MKGSRLFEELLRRRQLVVGAAIVVIVIMIGVLLGHPTPGRAPNSATLTDGHGTLAGAVEACEGAAPARCRVMSVRICAPSCLTTRYVVVRSAAGRIVARLPLAHGRFATTLAVGAYDLELFAIGSSGQRSTLASKRVTIPRGATRQVMFRVGIS